MNKKDKESFILHLKQKKKDNIKTEMFNSVNEYIVNNTRSIQNIKEQFKAINKINDDIGYSIKNLKRELLKSETTRLFYDFVQKITCIKKSPQYKDYVFFMIGDKVCIQHDIKYNVFLIDNPTLFMENISNFYDKDLINIREYLVPMFNGYFGYDIKSIKSINDWFVFNITELEHNLSFCIPIEFKPLIK